MIINIFLFFENDGWKVLAINSVKSYSKDHFQYKEQDGKVFEKWSPVSRIMVFRPHGPKYDIGRPYLMITNDAGGATKLNKYNEKFWNIEYFRKIMPLQETVYLLKRNGDALIVGSGGGIDVLAALVFQQKSITAVEINPIIASIVTGRFADYIGHIFNYPQVKLYNQEGRNFVARTREKYDTIQVAHVEAWNSPTSGYMFNENTLYTKEAIHDYISHLKPNGILSISRFYFWDDALRLTNTIVDYLEEQKIGDIKNRIVVMRHKIRNVRNINTSMPTEEIGSPYYSATVLYKNGQFDIQEVNIIRDYERHSRSIIVYAPYLSASQMDPATYSSFYRGIILSQSQKQNTRKKFVAAYPRNITPATDDKPFFFFMSRFRDIFNLHSADHAARRFAILLLYGICLLVGIFNILMILLPLYLRGKFDPINKSFPKRNLLYFALIGIGFMLIELSLVQRLTVFLGEPVYALIVVLSSLLLSGAIGSLISTRLAPIREGRYLRIILQVIIGLGIFIAFVVYDQLIALMWLNTFYRILLCIAIIFPLGLMLGMCLPLGMRIIQKWDRRLIVWAWGINGSFSVFGAALSIILAINFGLKAVFLIGIGCYLASWVIIRYESKPL